VCLLRFAWNVEAPTWILVVRFENWGCCRPERSMLTCGQSSYAQINGFTPNLRKRQWMFDICVHRHPVKWMGLVVPFCS
jgi:hypothetical protein